MKAAIVVLIGALLTSASVQAYSCGGLLEGDAGELQFPIEGNAEGESNCLWIIKLLSGNGIRFTLTKLGSAGVVSLYPEHEATETILNPIRLEAAAINSTILATGKVLIVTLSKSVSSSGVSFTWESDAEDNIGAAKAASYVDTPEGRVSFSKFGRAERLTWGLGVDPSENLKIHATTDFGRCSLLDPCMCTYFALYEVTPEGYLREATRVCGRPSEAVIENLYSQIVAFIYVNTTAAEDPTAAVEITWIASGSDTVTTTTTTTTTTETTTSGPPSQELECGGIINIDYTSANPEVFYVEYKLDTLYENNEFCVWTINSTVDSWEQLQVTLIEDGFEQGADGLDAYTLYFDSSASSTLSQCSFSASNRVCSLEYDVGILAFSSDSSVRESGFRAALAPSGVRDDPRSAFHFNEPEVVLNYPVGGGTYQNYDRVSMVFQQNGPNYLEITRLETESGYDIISAYTIYAHYTRSAPQLDGRFSGAYPDGVPGSLSYAYSPRIVTFTSDGSNTRDGFEITLRREAESGTTAAPVEQLECGGIINVTVNEATYVEYKADSYYDDDEFCIWTVESPTGWERATVTVESESFEECCDGIEVYYMSSALSSSSVVLNKIRLSGTNDSAVLLNGVGFIAFSSDTSRIGTGFRLRIEATPPTVDNTNVSTFFIDEPKGTFKYPEQGLYRPNDRVLTVLQLTNNNSLSITYLNIENGYDYIHLFAIPRFADDAAVIHRGPWSGSYPGGVGNSPTTAASPEVVLFTSDNSGQLYGFEIQWEEGGSAKQLVEVQTNKSKPAPKLTKSA